MSTLKRITIGADDFAVDPQTSAAILELADLRHISAVSCLTDWPLWPEVGREMLRYRDRVLMGLHFNLTQEPGAPSTTLRRTILAAVTRRLDPRRVAAALVRQIDRFAKVAGCLPDFIDGHQHVHALPVVAAVVRRVAEELNPPAPIPIRSVRDFFGPTDAPIKRGVIRGLAALGSRETARLPQRRLNTAFAGDYSLRPRADFAGLFQTWLELAPDRAYIMCHPRRAAESEAPSAGARELRFLRSPVLASLLEWHSIRFLRRDEIGEEPQSRAGVARQSTAGTQASYPDRAVPEKAHPIDT